MNDMHTVWIVGADGRVGQEIKKLLNTREVEVLTTDKEDVNITNSNDVSAYALMNHPHYIINCAGLTDVQKCEEEVENAFKVNALGARNLSTAARKIKARLVHLSTDDVFDGNNSTPYNEFDNTNPQTMYGKSKLAGENFVKELASKHIIIRSSWIFGKGDDYLSHILKMAKNGEKIHAAIDQVASPTSAKELAKMIVNLMFHGEDGLYHITCQGSCSRYEFVQEILRLNGAKSEIIPVTAKEDLLTAMRPSYSVLDNLMLRMSDLPLLPEWKIALKEYMEENSLINIK